MQPTSLLVAALLMLRNPCTRTRLAASILLNRAAQDTTLSPADREACQCLADELEFDAEPSSMEKTVIPHRNAGVPFVDSISGAAVF